VQLIPAIDIRDGRCVRLLKGDFDRETRYDVDAVELALRYRALGAEWLHVVDLDGAATGRPANLEQIATLAAAGLKIQLGGGIRDRESLGAALDVAERVVLGSLAAQQPDVVAAWMAELGPERFTLGFDVRIGAGGERRVTTHGWTQSSDLTLEDVVARYADVGLAHVLCTDVERDGALSGPNVALYADCVERWPGIAFQASGGVRDAADLERLAATGVAAAVSGKALLEGRLTDEEIRRFLPNA
jgi:phosphoribosylformimino-5-aminoimidazole carboxamide ribotide isomerase